MMPKLRAGQILLCISLLMFAGCAHHRSGRVHTKATPAPVPLATAHPATIHSTVSISGVIAPFQNVAITSSLSEPVDEVRVLQGDHVRAGQILAVLDTADLRAQLAQAAGTVASDTATAKSDDAKVTQQRYTATLNLGTGVDQAGSAYAAVAQAQQTLNNDMLNLNRDRALLGNGYVAQQTVDQQQTTVSNDQSALRSAQASLRTARTNESVNGNSAQGLQASTIASTVADANAARAAIEVARGQVAQYQASIDKATIVSPVDGVIVNRNVNPGEYPGSRTIFTVQQLSKVYADLNASSVDIFAIPVGATVNLTVSGAGSRSYAGKVNAVLGQVTPGSTDFTVQTIVQNPDGRLQAGLPVTAAISLPAVSGIAIPTTAFLDDSHTSVMVADTDGDDVTARDTAVHELSTNGTLSIINGIGKGTPVVANGQLGLTNGQTIQH